MDLNCISGKGKELNAAESFEDNKLDVVDAYQKSFLYQHMYWPTVPHHCRKERSKCPIACHFWHQWDGSNKGH